MELSSRDARQKICVNKWLEHRGCASIEACTGFGCLNRNINYINF